MYNYNAKLLNIVDGDTVDMEVDLGFKMTTVQRFRLMGYNAPETRGPERDLGKAAKEHLQKLLPLGSEVAISTAKSDSFGRYLCSIVITLSNMQVDLVEYLCRGGYGVQWNGKGKRPGFNPAAPYPIVRRLE